MGFPGLQALLNDRMVMGEEMVVVDFDAAKNWRREAQYWSVGSSVQGPVKKEDARDFAAVGASSSKPSIAKRIAWRWWRRWCF